MILTWPELTLTRTVVEMSKLRLCKMKVLKYYVKIKHKLKYENKANENKVLSYSEALI